MRVKMTFLRTMVALCVPAAAVWPASATLIDFNINQDGSAAHVLQLQLPSQVDQPYELFPIDVGPLAGSFGSIEQGGTVRAPTGLATARSHS